MLDLDLDLGLCHPAHVRIRVRMRLRVVPKRTEPAEPAELRVLVERLEERRVHVDRHVHVHSHADSHPVVVEGRVAPVLMLLMRLGVVGVVDRRLGGALARRVCGVRGGAVTVARGARWRCRGVRLAREVGHPTVRHRVRVRRVRMRELDGRVAHRRRVE